MALSRLSVQAHAIANPPPMQKPIAPMRSGSTSGMAPRCASAALRSLMPARSTEGVDRDGRAMALDVRGEITAVSRIRGTKRILEDTRGHDGPPIRVLECTRGHGGVLPATPSAERMSLARSDVGPFISVERFPHCPAPAATGYKALAWRQIPC